MKSKNQDLKATILLEQYKRNFTKSEMKIYQFTIHHPNDVIYYSLTEMAESCNVGEATVLRLLRKLGYKGFQEFKFSLAKEMDTSNEDNDDESIIFKVKKNMIDTLENSYEVIDEQQLEEAVERIDTAKNVVVFGVGSSAIAALDMQNRLLRIGKNIEVFNDPHSQVMRTASMDNNTVVIAISISGSTKDTVDSVQSAKENNAQVISITNYSKSPLTKLSDCILMSAAKESPLDSGSLISKVAQLYIIDLICTVLSLRNYTQAENNKLSISKMITGKLY